MKKELHDFFQERMKEKNSEGKINSIKREEFLNPKTQIQYLYVIFMKRSDLHKKLSLFEGIFGIKKDKSMRRSQENKLKKFNKGLAGLSPKIFQECLHHSIMIDLRKFIELIKKFSIKFKSEMKNTPFEKWNIENNEKFNEFILETYGISRKIINKYYVHDELIELPEENNAIINGYNLISFDLDQCYGFKEYEEYIDFHNKTDIDLYNWIYDKKVF